MPPRISVLSRVSPSNLCFRPAPSNGLAPVIGLANASSLAAQGRKRRHRDPYAVNLAKQKKLANIKRQEELRKEREASLGDPVRGIETPFLRSFDTVGVVDVAYPEGTQITSASDKILNHFLTSSELQQSFEHSYHLTKPFVPKVRDVADPAQEASRAKQHQENHERATKALSRIVNLANSSQKDKTRVNVRRCIETFGRHVTDAKLKPRAPAAQLADNHPEKTPRAGVDTGSSEVQVAILTAKIRVLANHLEAKGAQKDKVNKRNLRLMVHRRQKLLAYLRRKERGGERWQNLVSTLGLTDGTWKGEISL